jgi:hypothetical protein
MNIIRTTALELNIIPAIAYKQKLASGGACLKVQRLDSDATAVFTIDRRTAELVPYRSYPRDLFPEDALQEALELTQGIPYSARGKIIIKSFIDCQADPEDVTEDQTDAVDMVDSTEYKAIISRYSDEKNKLNYTLMNKDFIQFAARSSVVGDMIIKRAHEDEILKFIVQSRVSYLSGQRNSLDDVQITALIETLDEIDPRSAFKELKSWIRRMLAR